MEQKTLTRNGISGLNFLFIITSIGMIGLSIYLTTHYYETLFPVTIGGNTICNISDYFNCDAATYSKISAIAGVPLAFFGIIVGLMFLFASFMPSQAMEKTASAVSKYNLIGCISLFIYSLVVLRHLCPFCTAYYLSLIHISEPTRRTPISYAVFCLK